MDPTRTNNIYQALLAQSAMGATTGIASPTQFSLAALTHLSSLQDSAGTGSSFANQHTQPQQDLQQQQQFQQHQLQQHQLRQNQVQQSQFQQQPCSPQTTNVSQIPQCSGLMQSPVSPQSSKASVPHSARKSIQFRRTLSEREEFLIFVKILFRFIDRARNPELRSKAKAIVCECTRRNRLGDMNYTPLMDAVECRLKLIVGEMYWTRAKICFNSYCRQKGLRSVAASVAV